MIDATQRRVTGSSGHTPLCYFQTRRRNSDEKEEYVIPDAGGCLALSLTACGGQSESGAGDADSSAPSGDGTITLGMIGPLTGQRGCLRHPH